jgi:hypothetical protein
VFLWRRKRNHRPRRSAKFTERNVTRQILGNDGLTTKGAEDTEVSVKFRVVGVFRGPQFERNWVGPPIAKMFGHKKHEKTQKRPAVNHLQRVQRSYSATFHRAQHQRPVSVHQRLKSSRAIGEPLMDADRTLTSECTFDLLHPTNGMR